MIDSCNPLIAQWHRFREAFVGELACASIPDLTEAWSTRTARTHFYAHEEGILSRVAAELGLSLKRELFKVDGAMGRTASNGEWTPLIFVESENNAADAKREMRKLCALSCPLAVLITVCTWATEVYPREACRNSLIEEWQRIIDAHAETWPRSGIIGIIVGEWGPDNCLRFYSLAYSLNGSVCVPEQKIYERSMRS